MSINRRTAIAVRSIGVASAAAALALGVAGNAFACSISEFTPAASCDDSGHGVITVLDKDVSHTPVNITLKQGKTVIGTQKQIVGSAEGVTVTFKVDWTPSTKYTVKVVKSHGGAVGSTDVTTPDKACATPPTTPPVTPPSTPPVTPPSTPPATPPTTPVTTTPPATPSASATASAPAVGDTSSPAPSPSGNLAETGGGSNTGMIAGIAGALVVAGGGTVFMLRRRSAGARH